MNPADRRFPPFERLNLLHCVRSVAMTRPRPSSRSSDLDSPVINGEAVRCIFGDSRVRLLKVKDVGSLRVAARHHSRIDFPPNALRTRLTHSLHRIRLADGTWLDTVLAFDAQTVSEPRVLLAAMWLVEEQTWDEVVDILRLAAQCGRCTLPVRLTADDINSHANKTAYLAAPRVLAQLKMVGPHIDFGNGVTFQLFQHGDTLRAVKDQDGFEIDIDPPLPANHPYQQHRQAHDPPVRSRIQYDPLEGWRLLGARDYSSVSSLVKSTILRHFAATHQYNFTSRTINRHVDNDRLDTLLTQSPHTPVEGCTTTTSFSIGGEPFRHLVLTNAGHPFVAWIAIRDAQYPDNTVLLWVETTESAVSGRGGAFRDRFPVTTRLARAVLGPIISQRTFDR
ncbi:unnamed protein product [Vitrella brassicaformis CCMP3155]|uniref:Uncharacterized protein n=1 Tax=Vitrella brassicaformis (strain CCMP3155) TaxID=1169540 RepID=A0A0G4GNJ7_VITBC|nr:unnamed protein product [Vitrella brassicaformis CCMP3155]|eukprot:CEM31860.1 unnamed protein product [Vitrella brassicaformis CCMP3155]